MNFLDIRTVLFSTIISGFICLTVIFFLWFQNRRRSPELGFWLADYVVQFVAILLIALRGSVPDFISMVVGNALVIGGTLLLYFGLERYLGKTSPRWPNYLYLAAFIVAHTYFAFVQPNLLARNINLSLGLLVVCSQCAWLLLRRVDCDKRMETRVTGLIFVAYSLVSLIRIFVDLVVPSEHDFFKSGLYDTLAILIYQMLFIGLTFALLLMVNRRLFATLDGDIAARKLTEAALKKSEEKFSVAFQNIPDALVITSLASGEIIETNASFSQITGFTAEESLGQTTLELNLWGDLADRERLVEQLERQGRVVNFETKFRKKSGEYFTGWISSELIHLQGLTCALNVIQDVTTRQQAQEEIQRLSRFPAENPNPVLRIERNGRILYANPASAPILTTWGREVCQEAPDDWQAQLSSIFESGKEREIEMDCQGQLFSCFLVPILDEGYINLYGRDITEHKQAETLLAQLAAIVDSSDDAIIGKTLDGLITSWNSGAERLYGYTAGEVLAQPVSLLIPGDRPDELPEILAQVKRGETVKHFETVRQRKDGSRLDVSITVSPIKDASGQITGASTIARDITERKQAEEALHHSEQDLKEAQAIGHIGNWNWSVKKGEITWSDEMYRTFGIDKNSYTGRLGDVISKVIHPDDLHIVLPSNAKNIANEPIEYRIILPDGSIRYIWAKSGATVFDQDGSPIFLTGVAQDITERKQAEEALQKSTQRFKALLSQAPFTGVIYRLIYDNDGNISDWEITDINELGAASIGQTVETAIGKRALALFGEKVMAPYFEIARQVVASGQPQTFETYFEANDRDYLTSVFMLDSDHYANMSVDITARKWAEKALAESEARYRLITENTDDVIWVLDPFAGKFTYVSPSVKKLRGYTPAEVLAQPVNEALTPASLKMVSESLAAHLPPFIARGSGTESYVNEVDQPCKDGSIVHTEVTTTYIFNAQGQVEIVGVSRNITERKQAEKALRESEDRFRTFIESAPVAVSLGRNGKLIYVNPAYVKMHGFNSADELIGQPVLERIAPHEHEAFLERTKKRAQGLPTEPQYEITDLRKDGTEFSVFASVTKINLADGPANIGFFQDITERKKLENLLQESERNYRELVQNANSTIIRWKSSGEITFFNEFALKFFGYRPEEILGQQVSILIPASESTGRDLSTLADDIVAHPEQYFSFVNENVCRDGRRVWMACTNKPIYDAQGQLTEILSVGVDITERKQMEDELRRSNAELEQFAYVASHDLQEPLRTVAGMVQLLQQRYQGQLDARADEYIHYAVDASERMQKLISDLLDFSRVERRGRPFEPTNVEDVLKLSLANLQTAIAESQAQITHDPLPSVLADAGQLAQVFQNLLGNAIKFRGERPLEIHLSAEKTDSGWRFGVRDNGIGIDPQYFERVFLLFQRLHTRRKYPGTGIGLALCKKIVERHGGKMWIESELNQGATFFFTLPERQK